MSISRTLIIIALLVILITTTSCIGKPRIGSTITFGGSQWRVLDVKDNTALIISEQLIGLRSYHSSKTDITWEKCSLREYLNNEYYNKFTEEEKARIIETKNSNPPNLWYGTKGGADTVDKIFLLSLEEVVKYFGDSGDYKNKKRQEVDFDKTTAIDIDSGNYKIVTFESPNGYHVSDKYNDARIAKDKSGRRYSGWWLRTPGENSNYAAFVDHVGSLIVSGGWVGPPGSLGVRPAMWVKM